jgi:hypothetical protein
MKRMGSQLIDVIMDNSDRRELGKGMMGDLLNREYRPDRMTSEIRAQMDELDEHRYFPYNMVDSLINCLLALFQTLFHLLGLLRTNCCVHSFCGCVRHCPDWHCRDAGPRRGQFSVLLKLRH